MAGAAKTWAGYAAFRRGELLWGCFDTEREIVERYQCACYARPADDTMSPADTVAAHGITVERITITRKADQ